MSTIKHIGSRTGIARVLLLTMMLICGKATFGQCNQGMEGTDFWLMFLQNTEDDDTIPELSVVAAASSDSTVIILSIPNLGYADTTLAQAGEVVKLILPYDYARTNPYGIICNNGIHVTSSSLIALYASNFHHRLFDMTALLPTESLDTSYLIQTVTYTNGMDLEEIGFVALEDNTILSIVFRSPTEVIIQYDEDPYPFATYYEAYDTLQVTLNSGQSFQLSNNGYDSYLSFAGTQVFSNGKPFAAFQGSYGCNLRLGDNAVMSTLDHLYEQTIPTKYWGRRFLIIPTYNYSVGSDIVEVMSATDNCDVLFNGEYIRTLSEGETFSIELRQMAIIHGGETDGYLLETSEQACVFLYMGVDTITDGNEFNQYHNIGDPSSVYIPPMEQGPESVMFQTVNTVAIQQHYVNVTVKTTDTATVRFDQEHVQFHPLDCGYSYATFLAPEGVHHITSNNAQIQAIVYGRGTRESYAYVAGMSTKNLSNKIFANNIEIKRPNDTITACESDKFYFLVRTEPQGLPLEWFINDEPLNHYDSTYLYSAGAAGFYHISVAIPDACDTLNAYVRVAHDTTFIDTCICEGSTFYYDGIEFSEEGIFTERVLAQEGCEFANVNLHIRLFPQLSIDSVSSCENETTTLSVSVTSDNYEPLLWQANPFDESMAGQETDSTITIAPTVPTIYTITAGDQCTSFKSITVEPVTNVHAAIETYPNPLKTDDFYITAYDNSTGNGDRAWFVNDILTSEAGQQLYYRLDKDGDSIRIKLAVFNEFCSDTAEVALRVRHDALWAPNVFTPTLENNNRFAIITRDIVQTKLEIYNRRGLLVFSSDNPYGGWDGTHHGQLCQKDSYVWKLWYHPVATPNATQMAIGSVTLLR